MTYQPGDTIEIPITFTDPTTGVEALSVPDATIEIFQGNTQIVAATPLTQISGGRYFFTYTIPSNAANGTYTAYITGTVNTNMQTATLSFSVTNSVQNIQTAVTNLQTSVNNLNINATANQIELDNQLTSIENNIGNPVADGTTLHAELQSLLSDIGTPLLTGQDITQKLDDIRTRFGLGTPFVIGTVTGVVTDNNGIPITNVRVVAINTANGNVYDTNITNNTGAYTLHLNPGTYVLEFVQATTVLQQTLNLTIPTMITTFSAPHIVLATKRTVTDVIKDPAITPIPGVLVKAILQANYNANTADNQVAAAGYTDVTGQFTLQLFPGVYVFLYIKSGFDTLPQVVTVV